MMDLIYLDYNCFQRGFDDQRQLRIRMEAWVCQELFVRAEEGQVRLVWPFMHEDETLLCPFPERKYETSRLSALCVVRIGPEKEIQKIAESFQEEGGLSAKDAVHLACAAYSKAQFFLSCDDQLVKKANRLELEIEVMNPVDYIREVVGYGEGTNDG